MDHSEESLVSVSVANFRIVREKRNLARFELLQTVDRDFELGTY